MGELRESRSYRTSLEKVQAPKRRSELFRAMRVSLEKFQATEQSGNGQDRLVPNKLRHVEVFEMVVHAKGKTGGESVSVYLSDQMLQEIDRRKGAYFSRSRFIYWALNEFFKGNDITDGIGNLIEKQKVVPQGASVPAATIFLPCTVGTFSG
jgi:hypothetical protein